MRSTPPDVLLSAAKPLLTWVQVLRGFAALGIVIHHGQNEALLLAASSGGIFLPSHALPWMAGVDLFFMISGFVMVYASAPLFEREGAWRTFLLARVIRVAPLYWLVTAAYVALLIVRPDSLTAAVLDWREVGLSFLFIPFQRADQAVQPVYSLGWTLNYEMVFYALFACVLALPIRRAVLLLITALTAGVAIGYLFAPLPAALEFWTRPIILEFALGAGLGLARISGLRVSRTALVMLAFVGLSGLYLSRLETDQTGWCAVFSHGLPALALIAAAVLGPDRTLQKGFPFHRFRGRFTLLQDGLVRFGSASYALYLIHPFALRGTRKVFETGLALTGSSSLLFLVAAISCSVIAALTVHRLIEIPVTQGLKRWLLPKTVSTANPAEEARDPRSSHPPTAPANGPRS